MSEIKIPTMSELYARGIEPEILFWVGCAGAFDERYKKVTKSIVLILNYLKMKFAVLGEEESCTGDPARRAGNEFLFQMQALSNIDLLNKYKVKTILTACPHCFNTIKNDYPDLGGNFRVYHYSEFIQKMIEEGKILLKNGGTFKGKKITYHDSCYLSRANQVYYAPRLILEKLDAELVEMERIKKKNLCCGAGGAQMFKEAEKGNKEINIERTEEALKTGASIIAVACPFCMTMLIDGIKNKEKNDTVEVKDIAELIYEDIINLEKNN